ncbi:MAG: hypothetical protein AAF529_03035 [Pseudomonadota bacterium]
MEEFDMENEALTSTGDMIDSMLGDLTALESGGDDMPMQSGSAEPYDLPTLAANALQDGDVLMMRGNANISTLIQKLDGGSYSHAAMFSWTDGAPCVWDHSNKLVMGPVPLEKGIHGSRWVHVYRFEKDGHPLGSDAFPSAPVIKALSVHKGAPYDEHLLMLAGVVALAAHMPKRGVQRMLLRELLNRLLKALDWYLDRHQLNENTLICTAVPALAFWGAEHSQQNHAYALEVDLARRSPAILDDELLRAVIAEIRDRFLSSRPELSLAGAPATERWVAAGGGAMPVNLLSPSDLEFSRTLQRVGRLTVG